MCRREVYGSDSSVRANDVFFALHAALLTALTLGQCAVYDRGQQQVSLLCKQAVIAIVILVGVYGLLTFAISGVSVLSWLYLLSLVKLGITISKYVPQVRLCVSWFLALHAMHCPWLMYMIMCCSKL